MGCTRMGCTCMGCTCMGCLRAYLDEGKDDEEGSNQLGDRHAGIATAHELVGKRREGGPNEGEEEEEGEVNESAHSASVDHLR